MFDDGRRSGTNRIRMTTARQRRHYTTTTTATADDTDRLYGTTCAYVCACAYEWTADGRVGDTEDA